MYILFCIRVGGVIFYEMINRNGVYFRYVDVKMGNSLFNEKYIGVYLTSKGTIDISLGLFIFNEHWVKCSESTEISSKCIFEGLAKMIDPSVKPPDLMNTLLISPSLSSLSSLSSNIVKKEENKLKNKLLKLKPELQPIILEEEEYKNKQLDDICIKTSREHFKGTVACKYVKTFDY
jgi:hypothetical protein